MTTQAADRQTFDAIATAAQDAAVFSAVVADDAGVRCDADGSAEEAWYRVFNDGDTLYVSVNTADRWLSESIEAELVHVGDDIEELLEEELVDQGYDAGKLPVEHFRDDEKVYVFRSPIPAAASDTATLTKILLAYEACFRELGDMVEEEED